MIHPSLDGAAIVYCDGAFQTTNGKTAHGLTRRTRRYEIASVIDGSCSGKDAGEVLDGKTNGIPLVANLSEALQGAAARDLSPTHFVIGIAPDGGRITTAMRQAVLEAIDARLNVDCGLHDFLSEDAEISRRASEMGVRLRDVRKPPSRDQLHGFSGKIEEVDSLKIAVLGTDSAVGKRTTAWLLADALVAAGAPAEMIGTGQTAWMQGARYGIILDALINDFVAGELEHAVWSAWSEQHPRAVVVEGQGSLMNPAYPGGLEILAATRPNGVVLQHAPARKEYDGFAGYAIHPLDVQIQAIELLSGKPVVAITINHEDMTSAEIDAACVAIKQQFGRPAFDVLRDGAEELAKVVLEHGGKTV